MSATTRSWTLADVAWPGARLRSNMLLVILASLVTAVAARIAIPLPGSPVPITGQTFAVLLSGAVLGSRRAALAQIVYLAEGAFGLPVFAGGAAGFAVLAGPSGGYLLAFPLAAWIVGALAERRWDRRFATMLVAMLAGSAAIFAFGVAGLSRFMPGNQLWAAGVLPFLPGDLVKATLAAVSFPRIWKLVHRRGEKPA